MKMENAEEIFQFLEEFSKRKPKTIPQELNDYLAYVARTGDPVYQWPLVKSLFKEKLLNVITDFYETTPGIDIPPYPNVDPFNYDTMKNSLIERLDSFSSAPFTVQRICELLTCPRKQYNRVDKFMRAVEKNILVVSTREPGIQRHIEPENGEPIEPIVNGSDNNSDYNVDVEMEDMSWKENSEPQQSSEPQPSSSDTHISVDDIEARLKAKQNASMEVQDKVATEYESVTPPELNVTTDEQMTEPKPEVVAEQQPTTSSVEENKSETSEKTVEPPKIDIEMKAEEEESIEKQPLIIPEIKVDDAEMTEQRLIEQTQTEKLEETVEKESTSDIKANNDDQQSNIDESSSDSNSKDDLDSKLVADVQSSSEESSSSDNTDGNSNSPKTAENQSDAPEESSQSDSNMTEEEDKEEKQTEPEKSPETCEENTEPAAIENDNYSISDLKSELPQPPSEIVTETPTPEAPLEEPKDLPTEKAKEDSIVEESNVENTETDVSSS
jgi:serine/threonine-protein phosphatase 4 regulatory subunit 2